MKKKFLIPVIICLFICTFTFAGCNDRPAQKKPVKISINIWPGYACAFLAQEKEFFKKNNVEVELLLKKSTPESLKLFTDGEVDGVFDIFADIIMLSAGGIPARIVYIVDYSDTGDVVIGRPEIKYLSDLEGKKVSFEGINTFSHIFVLSALAKAGLHEEDLKLENIKAHDVLSALEENKIYAGHTWEPTKSRALKKGYKVLAKAGDFPGLITDVLVFTPEIIKERSDDILAILKSLSEALDYLKDHREESIKIMADKMGMTEEEMSAGLSGIHQLDLKDNVAIMTNTSSELYVSANMIADFYLKRGQLSKAVNVKNIIAPEFAEELVSK